MKSKPSVHVAAKVTLSQIEMKKDMSDTCKKKIVTGLARDLVGSMYIWQATG